MKIKIKELIKISKLSPVKKLEKLEKRISSTEKQIAFYKEKQTEFENKLTQLKKEHEKIQLDIIANKIKEKELDMNCIIEIVENLEPKRSEDNEKNEKNQESERFERNKESKESEINKKNERE